MTALARGVGVWAGIVLALLLIAGCTRQQDDGREVVRFWVMGYEGEVVAQLIPEFERRNPGIRVDLQQLPWTAAHEKLLTAFAGDALPDVPWLPRARLSATEHRPTGTCA